MWDKILKKNSRITTRTVYPHTQKQKQYSWTLCEYTNHCSCRLVAGTPFTSRPTSWQVPSCPHYMFAARASYYSANDSVGKEGHLLLITDWQCVLLSFLDACVFFYMGFFFLLCKGVNMLSKMKYYFHCHSTCYPNQVVWVTNQVVWVTGVCCCLFNIVLYRSIAHF